MRYYAFYTGTYYYYLLRYSEFINIIFEKRTLNLIKDIDEILKSNSKFQIILDDIFFKNENVYFIGESKKPIDVEIVPLFCRKKIGNKDNCILVNLETGEKRNVSTEECNNYERLSSWGYESLKIRLEKECNEI